MPVFPSPSEGSHMEDEVGCAEGVDWPQTPHQKNFGRKLHGSHIYAIHRDQGRCETPTA